MAVPVREATGLGTPVVSLLLIGFSVVVGITIPCIGTRAMLEITSNSNSGLHPEMQHYINAYSTPT
jgi:hypothetical protein